MCGAPCPMRTYFRELQGFGGEEGAEKRAYSTRRPGGEERPTWAWEMQKKKKGTGRYRMPTSSTCGGLGPPGGRRDVASCKGSSAGKRSRGRRGGGGRDEMCGKKDDGIKVRWRNPKDEKTRTRACAGGKRSMRAHACAHGDALRRGRLRGPNQQVPYNACACAHLRVHPCARTRMRTCVDVRAPERAVRCAGPRLSG